MTHSRGSSGGSNHASSGQFHAEQRETLSHSFCNHFWSHAEKRALPGSDPAELGKEGYDALMLRMREGTRTLEEMRTVYKERAVVEEDYAKKFAVQSKLPLGQTEVGDISRAFRQIMAELDSSNKTHSDLALVMRGLEGQTKDFINKRETSRRTQQAAIEKAWKNKVAHESAVNKARAKYESDCININTLNAQASVSQGKEYDKISVKLDKLRQTVIVNQKDYGNYVRVLKETYGSWFSMWKAYCDLCQDQEEERLGFIKNKLWDYSNSLSTVAVGADESAERSRVALEQVMPTRDLVAFVEHAGTGDDIPDAPTYVDYSQKHPTLKRTWQKANNIRSSTRIGMTSSPSTVDEINRSFRNSNSASSSSLAAKAADQQQSSLEEKRRSDGAPSHSRAGSAQAIPLAISTTTNPRTSSANSSPKKPLAGLAALEQAIASPRSSPSSTERKLLPELQPESRPSQELPASRFDISSSSRSRKSVDPSAVSSSTSKPGHISAGSFSRQSAPPLSYDSSPSQSRSSRSKGHDEAAPPEKVVEQEPDDDDPLTKAMSMFPVRSPAQVARARSRSRTRHLSGGDLASSTQTVMDSRQVRSSATEGNLQATGGNGGGDYVSRPISSGGRTPSPIPPNDHAQRRAASPLPTATMMNAPPPNQIPSVVGSYGQSFPGERRNSASLQDQQRPQLSQQPSAASSRHSANLTSPDVRDPYVRAASPTPFAGVGARGRSPSPQPFIPPRGASPGYANGRPASYANPNEYAQQPDPRIASPYRPSSQASQISQVYAQQPQQYQQPMQHQPPQQSAPAQQLRHSMSFPNGAPPPVDRHASVYAAPPPELQSNRYSTQSVPQQQQQYQASPPPTQGYSSQQNSPYHPSSQGQSLGGYQSLVGLSNPNVGGVLRASSSHSAASSYGGSNASQQPSQSSYGGSTSVAAQQQQHQSQQAMYYQRQQRQQQAQRAPSPAPTPPPQQGIAPPPPSNGVGKLSDLGRPILFYVKAMYDYEAPAPEYLSFNNADVIAVTGTAPDGWWQGERVGILTRSGTTFPSNFTEIIRQ